VAKDIYFELPLFAGVVPVFAPLEPDVDEPLLVPIPVLLLPVPVLLDELLPGVPSALLFVLVSVDELELLPP